MSRRLGNYELLKKIGSGGMAEVWVGRRASLGGASKAVAIKVLAQSLADDSHYRDLFMDEARLSMMLSHSNIVQVFDVGQDGDATFLVMEWVDGLNLAQIAALLRNSSAKMPMPVVTYVIAELLHALAYAHTVTHEGAPLGIVHRDVSPQNVLISVSGEVKLTDFGVARLAREDTSGLHIKGKLRYMAPEQVAGRSKASTVDLYAVGAVLHELLGGRKFRGDGVDDVDLYRQVANGTIPALVDPDIPKEIEALRRALLAPDPGRRVQTASDALALLERWPGYRNASIELGKMCRWFMGVQAPRSGLHERVQAASQPPASAEQAPTRTAMRPQAGSSEMITVPDENRATSGTRWGWIGAAVGGLALLTLGLSWLRNNDDASPGAGEEVPEPRAVRAPSVVGTDPVRRAPSTVPPVQRFADAELDREAPDEPVRESPQALAQRRSSATSEQRAAVANRNGVERRPKNGTDGRDRKPSADRPAVPVEFRLAGPRLAFVRVDGSETMVLQPMARAKLEAGRHRIEWKTRADAAWTRAKPIRLRPGKQYVLEVTDAGPRLRPVP